MPASAPTPQHDRTLRAVPQQPRAHARGHLHAVPDVVPSASGLGAAPPAHSPSPSRVPGHRAVLDGPPVDPPPDAFVQRLAVYAFEVLEGVRSVAQFGGWITPEVAAALKARRALRAEREALTRDRRRRTATPGRAHLSTPLPHIIEATVVLHIDSRSTVVAIRLEHRRERWRATDITVL